MILVGEDEATVATDERLMMIETNMDDISPQILGHVMDRAFEAGRARLLLHSNSNEEEPARSAVVYLVQAGGSRAFHAIVVCGDYHAGRAEL